MTKEQFIALCEKCIAGKCSIEELNLLEKYQDDFELTNHTWLPEMGDPNEIKNQIITNLRSQIQPNKKPRVGYYARWAVAASLLIFASAGVLWLTKSKPLLPQNNNLTNADTSKKVVMPGGNKAILTLADGKKVDLDASHKGLVSKQGAIAVSKLADGRLAYNAAAISDQPRVAEYNTITTPRGGQYQVTLADGTQVWLNAASSIKYPTVFTGTERRVELTGEAYFEVAKNKAMSFRVSVNGLDVKVLGTHFNVMAYQDESSIETTLLEGSVKLTKGESEIMLVPGKQGVLKNGSENFKIRDVNVNDIVAWKNGLFIFHGENIQVIMRKVARWYDVDVDYKGNLVTKNYGGTVSRFADISYLLKTLELTGTIHFKTEGRRVTVMP